ncbi:unnamed protein product [Nyctereutes procyonoides]|uniref:Beta-defensin n=1 Tax=Nyctereutes procyonoides TaxID=34880 RepID=A0A811YUC5_NYCPR|nr:unnamed protein product [Nyctereutes procyonoides]
MKILLSFIILSFGVFIPPAGCDQSVTTSTSPLSTICRKKFEILYSERQNTSTIFEKANYGTKKKQSRSKEHYTVFNWWDACIKPSSQCKNKCGEKEFKMAYCGRPTTLCCMKECDRFELLKRSIHKKRTNIN